MLRILSGNANEVQREVNALEAEGWRFVPPLVIDPQVSDKLYAVMERREVKPKPPTVTIREDERPAMGRV